MNLQANGNLDNTNKFIYLFITEFVLNLSATLAFLSFTMLFFSGLTFHHAFLRLKVGYKTIF